MIVEFDITPEMFYSAFAFYEGELQLDFPYYFEKKYIMKIWGIDLYPAHKNLKEQITDEILNYLEKKLGTRIIFKDEFKGIFINGISELSFYDVDEINFEMDLLMNENAKRIKSETGENVNIKYIRKKDKKNTIRKKFEFPDATIYFPYSWMKGYIYAEKNEKLKINLSEVVLLDNYINNAKEIYEDYRKRFQKENFYYHLL